MTDKEWIHGEIETAIEHLEHAFDTAEEVGLGRQWKELGVVIARLEALLDDLDALPDDLDVDA